MIWYPQAFYNKLTVDSGIVGLHVGALDFAILNDQRVTLAAVLAEDSSTLKSEFEIFVELSRWIAEKADLCYENPNEWEDGLAGCEGRERFHTSVLEVGSRVAPQAFMLRVHQRPKSSPGD